MNRKETPTPKNNRVLCRIGEEDPRKTADASILGPPELSPIKATLANEKTGTKPDQKKKKTPDPHHPLKTAEQPELSTPSACKRPRGIAEGQNRRSRGETRLFQVHLSI